jgi:hypothetical protein
MVVKRGDNTGSFKVLQATTPVEEEMAALEKLGRNSRQSLYDAPMKISALSILNDIVSAGYDPKDPDIDRFVSRGIMVESMRVIMRDRSKEDAELGVRPLRRRAHGQPRSGRSYR